MVRIPSEIGLIFNQLQRTFGPGALERAAVVSIENRAMTPDPTAIERQIEAILVSKDFAAAPKMRALLRYLVDATLAGDAERIRGYAIGVDVFDRGVDFDPATDPIVRVQAGRLRKLLAAYYQTAGHDDPIRIEIPKGSYAVSFLPRAPDKGVLPGAAVSQDGASMWRERVSSIWERGWSGLRQIPAETFAALTVLLVLLALGARYFYLGHDAPAPSPPPSAARHADDGPITLAVLPFTNMSRDATRDGFADGLSDALTTALARVKSISLVSRTSAFRYRKPADLRQVGAELKVRYIIEGGVQHEGRRVRVNVQLIDAVTGAHIWAHEYDRDITDDLTAQSELVMAIAAEIRPQLYSAAKRAIEAEQSGSATAWQLYLQSTWVPGEARNSLTWEKERIALAERALALDPSLGQAHSVLADKLAYLANVDPPSDTAEARAAARGHARKALELSPADADVMFNIAVHHWHMGNIARSLDATKRTLELDPNHVLARFLVLAVPYTCASAPANVIRDLETFDAALSPDNPVRWVTLYWISRIHLNNNALASARDAARRAEQIFRTPDSFYQYAAILVQLGETNAAVAEIERQRLYWPNLDPRHYAEGTIARRCKDAPRARYLGRVYGALADAVETATKGD